MAGSPVWVFIQLVLLHLRVDDYHNVSKLSCWPLAFTLNKRFLRNKKRPGTSHCTPCYAKLLQKKISFAIFYYLTKFHCLVVSTSWDIRKHMYCNCLLARLWRHKFWNSSYPSNQAVFPTWPKGHDKTLNTLRTKRAFKMK